MNIKEMTAPCGLSCFECSVYRANIPKELSEEVATNLGIKPEEVACDGCRSEKGCSISAKSGINGCLTKKCVTNKGLHNCSECNEFPCEYLMPIADGADSHAHNTKLYNLSRIKLLGFDKWAEEAVKNQEKYFHGKFMYGQEPNLD